MRHSKSPTVWYVVCLLMIISFIVVFLNIDVNPSKDPTMHTVFCLLAAMMVLTYAFAVYYDNTEIPED